MGTKIAIFHWGYISIHSYYLAKQLAKDEICVDFFLYTPGYKNTNQCNKSLFQDLKSEKINIIEIKCTSLETALIKLNNAAEFLSWPQPAIFTNPFLPFRTRKLYKAENYKYIITIQQFSLYWLYKTSPKSIEKVIHYSLEIQKITDPNIKKYSNEYAIIKQESKLLKYVKGLIIQDRLRAEALLHSNGLRKNLKIFYIPVSIPGDIIRSRSNYLYKKFGLSHEQKIILYFGAIYQERKIDDLINTFSKITNPDWVLIIHSSDKFLQDIPKVANIKISNLLLEYDELHLIISSATIGIAFYDNSWPNTRLTAFSSEKIARYLQAGVPFIAFKNESYISLKNEFNCCELIENINDLKSAIKIIIEDFDNYMINCFKAYNKYYNIKYSLKPLSEFLLKS